MPYPEAMGSAEELPYHLSQLQTSLVSQIESAFKGVSRQGGVSWHEAEAMDDYASPEELAIARLKDTDRRWQDLVNDPRWPAYDCPASWSFLDPIGFRYYLPAALIREVKPIPTNEMSLGIEHRLTKENLANLDGPQRIVVERVVQFLIANARRHSDPVMEKHWRKVGKVVGEMR